MKIRVYVPLLAAIFPLLLVQAQQATGGRGDDDRVEGSGPARSSFRGPELPAAGRLEDATRERCEPRLLARADGQALLLCVEYEVGLGDRIALRELRADGTLADPAAPPRLVDAAAAPAAIVRPCAALDATGRIVVVWTELVDGRAQLRVARGGDAGFAPSLALTSGLVPNRNAALARTRDGELWLAWEQWRPRGGAAAGGSFDVVAAKLEGSALGAPIVVAASRGSDLDPALASLPDGRLAIAWCRYAGRDYELALRTLDPASGALGEEVNVTADGAADDVHPALALAADGLLWLAWDRFEDPSRGLSTPADLRAELGMEKRAAASCSVRVAAVRVGATPGAAASVLLPKSRGPDGKPAADGLVAGAPLLSFSGGTPRLVALPDGRVQLLYRFLARQGPGGKAYGYPLLACVIDGEGIGPPSMLADSAGAPEEPAACASGSGVLVAWQQDHRLECETGTLTRPLPVAHFQALAKKGVVLNGSYAPSGIGLARIGSGGGAGRGAATATVPRVERLAPPHAHPNGDALDDPFVNGDDHFTIESGGESGGASGGAKAPVTYRVWWGDLHRHSSVSRCSRGFEPSAADRWSFGRDACLYDFMALTDHSCQVDALGWWRLDKIGELAASPRFVALAGFEWSTGLHGHQNVILRGGLRPFLSSTHPALATLPGLYANLNPEFALAIPHHPADVTRRTDFSECDPRLVRLVEIYQAQRGNYEFDGCFKQSRQAHSAGSFAVDAMTSGLEVGFVASTDHGEGASYACVLAESLDREHLFDAMRARRTYGATAKGLLVDFRIDGRLMGEKVTARRDAAGAATVKASLRARGTKNLVEAVVFRNGEPWRMVGRAPPDPAGRTELTLQIELAPPKLARAVDWTVSITASPSSGVAMKPWFELPLFARDDLGADHPAWRVEGDRATYEWKGSYAKLWEPAHSRLHVAGARTERLHVAATASDGSAAFERDVTLADLADAAGTLAGESPLGAWRLSSKESFDAGIDLGRSLGVRELTQEWDDSALPEGASWYYARILQSDGEMAWSSPIFVDRP